MELGKRKYLTVTEAAEELRLSTSTLNKLRCYGGGPVYRRFGRAIRYPIVDLEAWADQNRMQATSDYGQVKRG